MDRDAHDLAAAPTAPLVLAVLAEGENDGYVTADWRAEPTASGDERRRLLFLPAGPVGARA